MSGVFNRYKLLKRSPKIGILIYGHALNRESLPLITFMVMQIKSFVPGHRSLIRNKTQTAVINIINIINIINVDHRCLCFISANKVLVVVVAVFVSFCLLGSNPIEAPKTFFPGYFAIP